MNLTSAAVEKVECLIFFLLRCEMTSAVNVMACSSTSAATSDASVNKVRRWSSIGIRKRTGSFDNRTVCLSLISYTNYLH